MSLKIDRCSYWYSGHREAVRDLSVTFEHGKTVLLGPNGAGKTTLLKLCASVLLPRSGDIALDGTSLTDARGSLRNYRRSVAWLPQSVNIFPGLSVREQVAYVGWLKGLPRRVAWERSQMALERVDLNARANENATKLSGGQRRRMGIAQALVHDARAILLDEPTAGLDPNQRARFADTLGLIPESVTVVVSTHQIEDVHSSYDRVVVMTEGRCMFDGPVEEFLNHAAPGTDVRDRAASAYAAFVQGED